jgi:hypothetical protein
MFLQKLSNELLLLVAAHLDSFSLCCLFAALEDDSVEIIKLFVENCYIFTSHLESAAAQASARGKTEVVKALIDLVPHINYSAALRAAAEHDRKDMVNVLLQWDRDDIDTTRWRRLELPYNVAKTKEVRELLIHHNREAALPHMVKGGYIEEARNLLETTRQIPLDAKAEMLETAAESKNTDMVKLLRRFGYCSQRAYINAICRDDLSLADLLNGDPNGMVAFRRPLHEAVRASSVPGIEYLLDKGADPTLLDGYNRSAFDVAMEKDDELAIRALNCNRHQYRLRNSTRYATRGGKRRKIVS